MSVTDFSIRVSYFKAITFYALISLTFNYLFNNTFLNVLRIFFDSCNRFILWYIVMFIIYLIISLLYKKLKSYGFIVLIFPIFNLSNYKIKVILSKYSCDIVNFCNQYFGILFELLSLSILFYFIMKLKNTKKVEGSKFYLMLVSFFIIESLIYNYAI